MTTIREQVVQAIMQRLASLTPDPVLRRERFDDYDAVTVVVWDGSQETSREEFGHAEHTLDVAIEYARGDVTPRTGAEAAALMDQMYGELMPALFMGAEGVPDPTLGGLATSLDEQGMMPFTPDAALNVTGCLLTIEVRYRTRNGDPFNQ